ncbi:MAG: VWA domain-containing protein [bacterium]|nr:VWA domain-containing protein [bacterium]
MQPYIRRTAVLFLIVWAVGLGEALLAQTGGAVRNDGGVPVKLITTRATQLHAEPASSSRSAPCPAFKFWYVLPPEKSASRHLKELSSLTKDGFYRVAAGDSESEFKGWIAKDDSVEWHHRQAVKFAPKRGREPAHFFASKDAATSAASSGDVAQATHREPETVAQNLVLMPLLDVKDVKVDDASMQLYEVAFMAGHPETAPPGSNSGTTVPGVEGVITPQRVREESTVDVVFVVDSTGSMEQVIAQVRRSIESVTRQLASNDRLRPRLRFGLVAYRDTVSNMRAMEYLTRVFCTLEEGKDHQAFLRKLGQVRESGETSIDYPEDVLAGVAKAMEMPTLKWNPLGWKQIVVVGDSSMKVPDHPDPKSRRNEGGRTVASVKARNQSGSGELEDLTQANFVISAVRVKDPERTEDHHIGDQQFNQLTAGRGYNGKVIQTVGGRRAEDFSGALSRAILDALGNFDKSVLQGAVPAGGSPAGGSPAGGGTSAPRGATAADFPWPVLDIIEAVSGNGAGSVQFQSRYSTEFDADGNRVFVPHLFIRKGQLLSFTAMLDFLQGQLEDAGDPGSRDVATIVKGMQTVSATLNLAEPITGDISIERFLGLLLGFPLKNPIFQVTISDLAAMSQTDYNDWVQNVKAQKDTLKALTENAHIWRKLHHDAKEREAHAFVPMSDLP